MMKNDRSKQLVREYMDLTHEMHRLKPRLSSAVDGLTDGEAQVLLAIDHLDAPVPSRVSRLARTSSSALSQTLGSLEKKGRITRRRSEGDSRSVVLALTERGRADVDSIKSRGLSYVTDLVSHVGEEEFARFLEAMRKIREFQLESGAFERPCRQQHDGESAAADPERPCRRLRREEPEEA